MTNTFQECITYSKYAGLDFNRLRSGPFEGPAIVIPPALPEDTYSYFNLNTSFFVIDIVDPEIWTV